MPLHSFSPDGFHAESYTTLDPSRVKPNEAICAYTNHERSSMLWYHDHGMGMTSVNVYAGLAGLYLICDPADERLGCRAANSRSPRPSGPDLRPGRLARLHHDAKGR